MLTQLREKSQSFLILILFGMLIVVFIFFFGPQAQGWRPGGDRSEFSSEAATVEGQTIPVEDVEIAVRRQAMGGDISEGELAALKRQTALQVIEQEYIANQARKLGLTLSEDELTRYIASSANPDFPLFAGQDGKFVYDEYYAHVTQSFGASPAAYRRTKERELLVSRYMSFLAAQVKVSEAEIKEEFERGARTWNLQYVVVDPADFGSQVGEPTPEQVQTYLAANGEAVSKYYEDHKAEYDHGLEVDIRRVLIKQPKPESAEGKERARKTAQELLDKVKAGADFATVAQESSEDFYAKSGGSMGWRSAENSNPAEFAVYEKLEPGQITELQENALGFWFAKAEGRKPPIKRTLDEVKPEIGALLWREAQRTTVARQEADARLAKLKSGAALADVIPAAPAPAVPGAPEIPGNPPADPAVPTPADPAVTTAPAVQVQTTGPFTDDRPAFDRIPGIGQSKALARRLDKLTAEAPLVDEVIEVEGRFYLVKLESRVEPNADNLAGKRDEIAQRLKGRRLSQLFGTNWQAVLFGPVQQRDLFKRFGGGAFHNLLPAPDGKTVTLNEELFKAPTTDNPAGRPVPMPMDE